MGKIILELPEELHSQLEKYQELSNISADQLMIMSISAFLKADSLKFFKNDREQKMEEALCATRLAELERRKRVADKTMVASESKPISTHSERKHKTKMAGGPVVMAISDSDVMPPSEDIASLTDVIPSNL